MGRHKERLTKGIREGLEQLFAGTKAALSEQPHDNLGFAAVIMGHPLLQL